MMRQRRTIADAIQRQVRERAQHVCEYCHTSELWQYVRFTVDHILPLSKGGTDDLENLCLACFHCNRRKSDAISGGNPETGKMVALFHPRHDRWNEHFIWSSDKLNILGITPTGRATVALLEFNRERAVRIRAADILVNRHPPDNDAVL
jgi:5-methylcytosine-specific restriction endonuclease McrA